MTAIDTDLTSRAMQSAREAKRLGTISHRHGNTLASFVIELCDYINWIQSAIYSLQAQVEFLNLHGHLTPCPVCHKWLTSLWLCPQCGVRYELQAAPAGERAETGETK